MKNKEKKAVAARRKTRKTRREREDPKKLGHIAMAKMGYQELANIIILPPRAKNKVHS